MSKKLIKFKKLSSVNIFALMLALFILSAVAVTIAGASNGGALVKLEEEAGRLETQNDELKSTLAKTTSLTKVMQEAGSLGMGKPVDFLYLNRENPVAQVR